MNRNNLWRFLLVVLVLAWSLYEMYPPKARDLLLVFRQRAINNRDATFSGIVQKVQDLQKTAPDKPYENHKEAIGTNDITRYFPFFEAKNEAHPTEFILNRLQREAAGKIRLGLDLQGGTSVLMKMETNRLSDASDASAALSQAVEVLRKRVDRLGVAEPLIQPQGADRILVQLPGLSASDQESAITVLKKAAFLEFRLVHPQSRELIEQGVTEPGYQLMKLKEPMRDGKEVIEPLLVKIKPE